MRIVTLLFLACAACGGTDPPTSYTFVYRGAPENYEAALEAASEWNACGGVRITIARDGDGIPLVEVPGPIEDDPRCPCDGFTAPGTRETGPRFVEFTTDRDVRVTIAHELGHALGLAHEPGDRVMSPEYLIALGAQARVTSDDCAALGSR